MRVFVNSLLLVIVAALLSLNWILRADPDRRNVEFFPNMARSVPYDSFSANPNFADGMTLRNPAPGVVIRGFEPVRNLNNPYNDAQALARGAVIYATDCEICHGPAGKGDGTVAQRGFPMPPSLLAANARQLTDGQIYQIVSNGRKNMPSYAAQIDRADRWKAILYVRDIQRRNR
jgi:mono/diheme cytochrome c family protein